MIAAKAVIAGNVIAVKLHASVGFRNLVISNFVSFSPGKELICRDEITKLRCEIADSMVSAARGDDCVPRDDGVGGE